LREHVPLQIMLKKITDSIEIKDDFIEIRVMNFRKQTLILGKFVPLTDSNKIKDDSIEIRVLNFGKRTVLLGKVITDFEG